MEMTILGVNGWEGWAEGFGGGTGDRAGADSWTGQGWGLEWAATGMGMAGR